MRHSVYRLRSDVGSKYATLYSVSAIPLSVLGQTDRSLIYIRVVMNIGIGAVRDRNAANNIELHTNCYTFISIVATVGLSLSSVSFVVTR